MLERQDLVQMLADAGAMQPASMADQAMLRGRSVLFWLGQNDAIVLEEVACFGRRRGLLTLWLARKTETTATFIRDADVSWPASFYVRNHVNDWLNLLISQRERFEKRHDPAALVCAAAIVTFATWQLGQKLRTCVATRDEADLFKAVINSHVQRALDGEQRKKIEADLEPALKTLMCDDRRLRLA